MQEIVPRLRGTESTGAKVIGPKAVVAGWRLGDGSRLTIVTNLGREAVSFDVPPGRLLFVSGDPQGPGPFTATYLEGVA
jgi:maltooligosyltrehalose trehalohydrolase